MWSYGVLLISGLRTCFRFIASVIGAFQPWQFHKIGVLSKLGLNFKFDLLFQAESMQSLAV